MAEAEKFNGYFYDILSDMEELARNLSSGEDLNLVVFLDKLKKALSSMKRKTPFHENLLSFVSTLSPEEEDYLFYKVAVAYYEMCVDISMDEEIVSENPVKTWSEIMASKMIIEIMDEYLGYEYFQDKEDDL